MDSATIYDDVDDTDEGKARFLSPADEDDDADDINENTGGFAHTELMRDAYDDLLAVGLPLHTSVDRPETTTPTPSPNQRARSYVLSARTPP